jgi:hypothetical protein
MHLVVGHLLFLSDAFSFYSDGTLDPGYSLLATSGSNAGSTLIGGPHSAFLSLEYKARTSTYWAGDRSPILKNYEH